MLLTDLKGAVCNLRQCRSYIFEIQIESRYKQKIALKSIKAILLNSLVRPVFRKLFWLATPWARIMDFLDTLCDRNCQIWIVFWVYEKFRDTQKPLRDTLECLGFSSNFPRESLLKSFLEAFWKLDQNYLENCTEIFPKCHICLPPRLKTQQQSRYKSLCFYCSEKCSNHYWII